MPKVKGKKFSYTKQGKKAAKKAEMMEDMPMKKKKMKMRKH